MEDYDDFDIDDLPLEYYNSDDDVDDSLYFKEEKPESIEQPVKVNKFIQHMNVPMELIIEILKYTDLDTFVKLCHGSKDVKNVCDNNTWITKFKQIHFKFYQPIPTTYNDWLKLYYSLKFYDQADQYIDTFLRVKYRVYADVTYSFKITLVKPISDTDLISIFGKIGIKIYPMLHFLEKIKMLLKLL
jgi:hypothetical protein